MYRVILIYIYTCVYIYIYRVQPNNYAQVFMYLYISGYMKPSI